MLERLCGNCRELMLKWLAEMQDKIQGPGNGSGQLPLGDNEDPRQRAYHDWSEAHGGRKPAWVKADWVSLSKAVKLLGDDFLPTWRRYLKETDEFYRGKSPRKFLQDADRWRPGAARRPWQPGEDWHGR